MKSGSRYLSMCGAQIVYTLEIYGVTEILGIQYGFRGFSDPKVRPIAVSSYLCAHDMCCVM